MVVVVLRGGWRFLKGSLGEFPAVFVMPEYGKAENDLSLTPYSNQVM